MTTQRLDRTGPLSGDIAAGTGSFTTLRGRPAYRIDGSDALPPFLMCLTTASDWWAYVSSSGALAAGRVDPAGSVFPYETDDRLHDGFGRTGPVTLLRVGDAGDGGVLWRPFDPLADPSCVHRSITKTVLNDAVRFEERRDDLGLTFAYELSASGAFGLERRAELTADDGAGPTRVRVLDGLLNLMPWGVDDRTQATASTLADAYKRAELHEPTRLAVYSLETRITDRAEPIEATRATTAWSAVPAELDGELRPCLDPTAPLRFARDGRPDLSPVLTGRRGAYFLTGAITVERRSSARWTVAVDAARSQSDAEALRLRLMRGDDLSQHARDAAEREGADLRRIVASVDGLSRSGDPAADAHLASCSLFNAMRGGTAVAGYTVERERFAAFVAERNRPAADRAEVLLAGLPERVDHHDLVARAREAGDPDLERLALEYLPVTFARRHGDPSRPWNRFRIRVHDEKGEPVVGYEGNWRDIFQNWEALGLSYPELFPAFIAKFLSASTPDGFNPYRISEAGVDWEVPEEDDPWSHIGYWGDHQIVYLLRLLELDADHHPGRLAADLDRRVFSFADVPYRLRPHADMVADAKNTIDFDRSRHDAIIDRAGRVGADGRLAWDRDAVRHGSLAEKLLIATLCKAAAWTPGGGLWLNTQRPEWNDANNALVGNGLSVVTVFHLVEWCRFLAGLFSDPAGPDGVALARPVADWTDRTRKLLDTARDLGDAASNPELRVSVRDKLGLSFERYRRDIEEGRWSEGERREVDRGTLAAFFALAAEVFTAEARRARRSDGLVHSYNVTPRGPAAEPLAVEHLPLMLEGQAAAIGSGVLEPGDCADLVDALAESRLYRQDLGAYLLQPERDLPGFLARNVIDEERVRSNPLAVAMLDAGDERVFVRDAQRSARFAPGLPTSAALRAALDALADEPRWADLARDHTGRTLDDFESVFRHHAYLGRSGSMYKYEGVGCVYWHMMSKLVLAVQRRAIDAAHAGDPAAPRLADQYRRLRDGLGFKQPPWRFGAFPLDPHSHSPRHLGAQQPGMTGQTKENMLIRRGELGVGVDRGRLRFRPLLLTRDDFAPEPGSFAFVDAAGEHRTLDLPEGCIALTVCQTPVVFRRGDEPAGEPAIERVVLADGARLDSPARADGLSRGASAEVFRRTGVIRRIDVRVPPATGGEA